MTCRSCASAEQQPDLDEFSSGCMSCSGRALAVTGAHLESLALGAITAAYRGALEKIFGADRWRQGHELVKGWGEKLKGARRRAAATVPAP